MTKRFLPFAFLAVLTATSAGATPLTGTLEDRGAFDIIRLSNGEVVEITNKQLLAADHVYTTVVVDGVAYTVYDRGSNVGPIYAVPN